MENRLLLRLASPNTFIVNFTVASGGMDTGFLASSKEILASAS